MSLHATSDGLVPSLRLVCARVLLPWLASSAASGSVMRDFPIDLVEYLQRYLRFVNLAAPSPFYVKASESLMTMLLVPTLRHLDLADMSGLKAASLPECRALVTLNLSHSSVSNSVLRKLFAEDMPQLKHLFLRCAADGALSSAVVEDIGRHTPCLETLDLSANAKITSNCLAELFQGRPFNRHLLSLNLSKCRHLSDVVVATLLTWCPHITTLDLSGTGISDAAFAPLRGAASRQGSGARRVASRGSSKGSRERSGGRRMPPPGQRSIGSRGSGASPEKVLIAAAIASGRRASSPTGSPVAKGTHGGSPVSKAASALRSMSPPSIMAEASRERKQRRSLTMLRFQTRLRVVRVGRCANIGDTTLQLLSNGAPDLVELDAKYTSISNSGLRDLASKARHLEVLDLECCWAVDARGLESIARYCAALRSIWLGREPRDGRVPMTPGPPMAPHIVTLAERAHKLQTINLAGVSGVDDPAVEAICRAAGRSLESVVLRRCDRVTDVGCRAIASLSRLRHLDLSCTRVTDVGVLDIIHSCGGTLDRSLVLNGLPDVTDDAMSAIAAHCHRLTNWLEISGCAISGPVFVDLARSLGRLKGLNISMCEHITAPVLTEAGPFLHSLESLVAHRVRAFSAATIVPIMAAYPRLKLFDCPGLARDVAKLAKRRNLTIIRDSPRSPTVDRDDGRALFS